MNLTVTKRKKGPAPRLMERIEECDKHGQFKLDISRMDLPEVPMEINMVQKISTLVAYKNAFHQIPNLTNFKNISTLDISRNMITSLDNAKLGQLQNLSILDVSRNKLTSLPDDICRLPVLTVLLCHRNYIEEIPEDIGNVKSLNILDASHNHLTHLGTILEHIPRLESLNITFQTPPPEKPTGEGFGLGMEGEAAATGAGTVVPAAAAGGGTAFEDCIDCHELIMQDVGVRTRRLIEKHDLLTSKPGRRSLIQRALGVRQAVFNREQEVIINEQMEAYRKGNLDEYP